MLAPGLRPSDDAAFVVKVEQALAAAERDQAAATLQFIEVGRMLLERKEAGKRNGTIPHGQWVSWLERNFPPRNDKDRVRRLQHYMQAAEAIDTGDEATKTKLSSFLPEGLNAVLDEVRNLKRPSRPDPKPEPVRCDVQLTGEPFFRILQGDVRDLIADLPQVHTIITSPPYFDLITYGDSDRQIGHEDSVEAYIATLVAVFMSIPLHPQGSIWVNISDTRRDGGLLNIPGRFCTAMLAAGFLLKDYVIWAKVVATRDGTIGRILPEPCADRLNANGYEPFFRFVKDNDAYADTAAVQVPRNNVPPQRYLPEDLMKTVNALNGRNLPNVWLVSGRPVRRWSLDHYGCFPVELIERPIAMTCPPFVNPDGTLPRRIVEQVEYDDGIGPRTFGKSEPAAGISGRHDVGVPYTPRRPLHMGWEQVAADAVPGIICDPFTGTGSVGEVALKMGRSFIGVELYEQHVETARRRCADAKDYVREHYGYAAVTERLLNPPATPEQHDAGGDSDGNVIWLQDLARKVAHVWDDPQVRDDPAVVRYEQGRLIERALFRQGGR